MIILDLELTHFGKFHDKQIHFTSGLNIVHGKNEAGKSTIHAFVRSMLFGFPAAGVDPEADERYERYFPWDNKGGYEGRMRIELEGRVYRLERSFLRGNPWLHLYNETDQTELTPAEACLKTLLQGMNETNYRNTISIEQLKCITESQLSKELQAFITNTGQTKNIDLDVGSAYRTLMRQKDELAEELYPNAEQEYQQCQEDCDHMDEEINELRSSRQEWQTHREELQKELEGQSSYGEETMLAYERTREELRKRFEADQTAYRHAPAVTKDELERKNYRSVTFFILAGMFLIAAGYVYLREGMENSMQFTLMCGFCAAGLLGILVGIVSFFTFRRKRKRLQNEYEIKKQLKQHLEESAAAFETCKRSLPVNHESECERLRQELEEAEKELEYLDSELARAEQEREELLEQLEQCRCAGRQNQKIEQQLKSMNLAVQMMMKVANRVHDTFGNCLNKEASVLLARITGGKYDRISVDNEMNVLIHTGDRVISLDSVSRGTIEQVYLAIRIAAANLLWQKQPMPLILDDVFAYYDDERLELALQMLKSCGHQVIIFSCHSREKNFMK